MKIRYSISVFCKICHTSDMRMHEYYVPSHQGLMKVSSLPRKLAGEGGRGKVL